MSLRLQAVTSCLSAGHIFFFDSLELNTAGESQTFPVFCVTTVTEFLIFCHNRDFFTLSSTYAKVLEVMCEE